MSANAESYSISEQAWFNICLSFFEGTDTQGQALLQWFQDQSPDNDKEHVICSHPALTQILLSCGLSAPVSELQWYRFHDIKDRARCEAHKLGLSR